MLVKFDSEVGSLTMFGDIALQLLKLMGHSGTVPGALLPVDIPRALARLKTALDSEQSPQKTDARDDNEPKDPPVSLHQRAHPLIELLERAAREDCEVVWR